MSITTLFQTLVGAEHTFVAWLEKQYATFMKEAPTIEHFVEQGATYAVGVLKIVLANGVQSGSKAETAITKAIQDLLTASAVAFDAGAHPSLGGMFQSVVDNLSGLETAMGFKDAGTLATIAKVVSTISAIASTLLQLAPVVAAAV